VVAIPRFMNKLKLKRSDVLQTLVLSKLNLHQY